MDEITQLTDKLARLYLFGTPDQIRQAQFELSVAIADHKLGELDARKQHKVIAEYLDHGDIGRIVKADGEQGTLFKLEISDREIILTFISGRKVKLKPEDTVEFHR